MITRAEYVQRFNAEGSPGWDAINDACARVYPGQEPQHIAPMISPMLGGPDPLSGVSLYSVGGACPHVHMVSYGMSALFYDPDLAGQEFSGRGFEFTARVVPFSGDEARGGPFWMVDVMNNLARYLIETDTWFEPGHFINANGPLRKESATSLTAMAFVRDADFGVIDTPHGRVEFLQIVGLTAKQHEGLRVEASAAHTLSVIEAMRTENPQLVIDLEANPLEV